MSRNKSLKRILAAEGFYSEAPPVHTAKEVTAMDTKKIEAVVHDYVGGPRPKVEPAREQARYNMGRRLQMEDVPEHVKITHPSFDGGWAMLSFEELLAEFPEVKRSWLN